MSDLKIIYRDPKLLLAYDRNSRTHSPEQINQLRESIREFGFTQPILLKDDEKTIGAGHGRQLAAIAEGLDLVPTITLTDLTENQWRAYVIADNKLALNAGWNEEMLAAELKALADFDYNVGVIGFSSNEIDKLMKLLESELEPEEVPEPPVNPVSRLGDVWILGDHRIICGDCTVADTVKTVLGGVRPHLMVTDPPYGVEYDAEWRERAGIDMRTAARGKVLNDDRADWREAWALFEGDVAYVWHAGLFAAVVADSLSSVGLMVRAQIIWAKHQMLIGRGDYHWKHESCWYVVRKGKTGHWAGDRKQTTVWEIDKPHKSETGHSTQKPIECMRIPMENNSKRGDAIYEPFSGSGTTICAGEMCGRRVFAIELNEKYVDVAVERWQTLTSKHAVLESTGQNYDQVRADRLDIQ